MRDQKETNDPFQLWLEPYHSDGRSCGGEHGVHYVRRDFMGCKWDLDRGSEGRIVSKVGRDQGH